MMTSTNIDDKRLHGVAKLEDFRKFSEKADSGLFVRKTRRKLVGINNLSGKNTTKANFWLDQRNRVINALKDIEIFLMVSGERNVDRVFTFENVKPVIGALLWNRGPEPDSRTARIAQYLVESGFTYLVRHKAHLLSKSHQDVIDRAIDVSRLLEANFSPDNQRRYYSSVFENSEPSKKEEEDSE